MSKHIMGKRLAEYNSMLKEHEYLYRQIARRFNLSECSFWILYSLREANASLTQSELCYTLSQSKQTVNSALKKMESEGYIKLLSDQDRRRKQLSLTEKGEFLARETVDRVILFENQTFDSFTETEQEVFLHLFHKYTDNLKNNFLKGILNEDTTI